MSEQPYTREEIAKMSPAMEMATQLINGETSLESLFNSTDPIADDLRPSAEYPDRPDSQDFRDMIRIVADMDAVAESKGWEHIFLPVGIDPEAIRYIARQRVMRAQQLLMGPETTEWDRLAVMWIDAITLGMKFMQERMTVDYVLDESVDTHHRMKGHQ